ncbi:MAG: cyclase family protein [Flavobacteriales bacterium]|nr:cyclase family protein [Flavobacteriales bacterium]
MIATVCHRMEILQVDFAKPLDISIPLKAGDGRLSAWYVPPITMEPVRANGFVGSVAEGGSVNFRDIVFNPHGHGTHTECVGHISKEFYSVNQAVDRFMCMARLISIEPEVSARTLAWEKPGDAVITAAQIESATGGDFQEALIIRTLPNEESKNTRAYSNTNPPYLTEEAAVLLREKGVKHLLIDTPSVDRETDEGLLKAHHAFWNYPEAPRLDSTITELIYVPSRIVDGVYLLNLQFAPFENDASPSRPVLFEVKVRKEA